MKKIFESLAMIVCIICIASATTATPVSIVYSIYLWGGEGHEIGYSAWEGVKNWVLMLSALIPAVISYLAIK